MPPMLHVVEIRFCGEHFRDGMLRVRAWMEEENIQPRTFRYEADSVMRINFEDGEQAQAFAQAFGGVVLA